MSGIRLRQVEPGRWRLDGSLTLAGVADLAAGSAPCAPAGEVAELDLGGVDHFSSAAVALLLQWREQLLQAGGRLRLHNCPDALRRIAAFSNVDGLLGLSEG
jgi:anti-anti-sigma factor